MSRARGRREEHDEPRGGRQARRSGTPALLGVTMVLLVVLGALVVFMTMNKKPPAEATPEKVVDPFADLPPEQPAEKTFGELQRQEKALKRRQENDPR